MDDEVIKYRTPGSILQEIRHKVNDEARNIGMRTTVADDELRTLKGIYIKVVKEVFDKALRESGYIEDNASPDDDDGGNPPEPAYG